MTFGKKIFFGIAIPLFLCKQNSFAQKNIVDSLIIEVKKYHKSDTIKLNLLNNLVYYYNDIDSKESMKWADSAIALGLTFRFKTKLAVSYRNKAEILYYNSEFEKAIAEIQKGIAYAIKINDMEQLGICQFMNGMIEFGRGEYKQAIAHHKEAVISFQKSNLPQKQAGVLNSIGANYSQLSDFSEAMEAYYESLKLYETLNDSVGMALVIGNLGYVNKQLGKFDKALSYYERAENLNNLIKNKFSQIDVLMKIGTIYDSKEDGRKAISYYLKAKDLAASEGYQRKFAEIFGNIGIAYNSLQKFDSALYYLIKADSLLMKIEDKKNQAVVKNAIGKVLLQASVNDLKIVRFSSSKRHELSESFLLSGLKISEEIELIYQQQLCLLSLSELYEKTGRFKEGLIASRKAMHLKDSIFKDEKKEDLVKLELQHSFDKREAMANTQHAAAIAKQKTIRFFSISVLSVMILASLLIFWQYKHRKDAQSKQKEAELQIQMAENETRVLRLQMNPHFIFNSLNSISDYIRKSELEEADDYLTKFAKVMRMTLENSVHNTISLTDELNALEGYIQLEARRLKNKFTYEIQVDDVIEKDETMVPPMILQPFVENSIWHGISQKQGRGHIIIHIEEEGEMLKCSIEDDGIGRGKATQQNYPEKNKSLGMKITAARIGLLNQQKENSATVVFRDKMQGLIAELYLPLKTIC